MAAPLTGFTPLLLSSLALHLLLLGPLLALTPRRVSTGGASNRWTPGLCYREAGKVNQQQQHQRERAGESHGESRHLRPCRWTVVRIQPESCSGAQRAGGTQEGFQLDAARRAWKKRWKGLAMFLGGTCGPAAPSPPSSVLQPCIRSRSNSDGVGAAEGVKRTETGRKGVVSPTASPAFTFLLAQNGKKRAVQRTKTCAQRWPALRPHLTKRGAAGAFVHVSGLCRAPGSGERGERAHEVRRLTISSPTPRHIQILLLTNKSLSGVFPTAPSWCNHLLSGFILFHTDASKYTFITKHILTNTSDCIWVTKLDHICRFPTFDSSQIGYTDQIKQPISRDSNKKKLRDAKGGSFRVDRRAGNCAHPPLILQQKASDVFSSSPIASRS
ncbi:uncharacterized protein FYW49_005133 [Xenentodon cancila]